MGEPIPSIVGGDRGVGFCAGLKESGESTGLGGTEEGLHFAPHHPDEVEFGRAGGQEAGLRPGGGGQRECGLACLGPEIVQHHDQRRGESSTKVALIFLALSLIQSCCDWLSAQSRSERPSPERGAVALCGDRDR